jgi:hypothetical protein
MVRTPLAAFFNRPLKYKSDRENTSGRGSGGKESKRSKEEQMRRKI